MTQPRGGTPLLPEIIATARLLLRPPRIDDAASIFEGYAADREATRYLLWTPHESRVETEAFLVSQVARQPVTLDQSWVLTRPGEDRALGMIGIEILDLAAELGYVLAREEWRKGYMTEAASAVTERALAVSLVQSVWAICHLENVASARVLEKAGFVRDGVLAEHAVFPNLGAQPSDVYRYVRAR